MPNVTNIYATKSAQTASGNNTETRLLNQTGTYNGSAQVLANTVSVGDIFRIIAWGTATGGGISPSMRLRFYFQPSPPGAPTLLDSGNQNLVGSTIEWRFEAMITILSTGANGTAWCDGWFSSGNATSNKFMGTNASFALDTTQNQTMELTATLPISTSSFAVEQCSIEYRPTP
jgi:hypothetical protein